jgi:N-acyl-D-aspartate/D-glutamate deacylase
MQSSAALSTERTTGQTDDFSLNAAQMEFMLRVHNAAEKADASEDDAFFDQIVASEEWKHLFDDMSWDQAWDRYEIMIGACEDC